MITISRPLKAEPHFEMDYNPMSSSPNPILLTPVHFTDVVALDLSLQTIDSSSNKVETYGVFEPMPLTRSYAMANTSCMMFARGPEYNSEDDEEEGREQKANEQFDGNIDTDSTSSAESTDDDELVWNEKPLYNSQLFSTNTVGFLAIMSIFLKMLILLNFLPIFFSFFISLQKLCVLIEIFSL